MKPFNLKEAKAGAPVCTRDGRSVRIVCFDIKNSDRSIVDLVDFPEIDRECIETHYSNGQFLKNSVDKLDLFMAEEHYDINNFKPFDRVLVRDNNDEKWNTAIFSHYEIDENMQFQVPFVTTSYSYVQCIPYNDETAHLVGTTGMPSEKYVNW